MNYEQDIRIDETSLDIEWLEQPSLMMKYARYAAQSRLERDKAKENVDLVKAELDKKIRSNPDRYELGKITETVITSTILEQDVYKQALEDYLQAKYEADVAGAAVNAFDARKTALENLVRLYGQQYFAGPKIPRDLSWEREEKQKKVNQGIAGKMKRRGT